MPFSSAFSTHLGAVGRTIAVLGDVSELHASLMSVVDTNMASCDKQSRIQSYFVLAADELQISEPQIYQVMDINFKLNCLNKIGRYQHKNQ